MVCTDQPSLRKYLGPTGQSAQPVWEVPRWGGRTCVRTVGDPVRKTAEVVLWTHIHMSMHTCEQEYTHANLTES